MTCARAAWTPVRRLGLAGLVGAALAWPGLPVRAQVPPPALAPQASPARAQPAAEHEQQLEAIRQALLDATLSAPVRVLSSAWIDGEGRLHESAQFTSDVRVRGVRVMSYLEPWPPLGPDGQPRARGDARVLPVGVRPGSEDPQQCLAQQGRWRQSLHVEVVAATGAQRPSAALLHQTRLAFLEAARESRRWTAQPRPYQPATAYERALLGREMDQADWLARLAVEPAGDRLEAVIELGASQPGGAPRKLHLPAAPTDAVGMADWRSRVAAWVEDLDRQTACDPVWFGITDRGGQWRLREGAANGLRAGDRLLVVDRQHLSGRLLEPGAVASVALVQVASTGEGGTALRWLAGPRPPSAGDWVALPL